VPSTRRVNKYQQIQQISYHMKYRKSAYFLVLACGAFAAASTGFSQTSISINNASFESPSVTPPYQGISGAAGTSTLPGWNVSAPSRVIDLQHPGSNQTTPVAGQDATQFVEDFYYSPLNYAGTTNISQVLTTSFAAGYVYSLTADATVLSNAGGLPTAIPEVGDTFFIANSSGTVLASTPITGITDGVWSQFTVPFTSTGLLGDTGQIEIGFASPNGQPAGSHDYMDIDNFALTAVVPEPGSIAIIALGTFAVLHLRRRRRDTAGDDRACRHERAVAFFAGKDVPGDGRNPRCSAA
jgi:hypothetical protein